MNKNRNRQPLNRRRFIRRGVTAACAVAAIGGAGALIRKSRRGFSATEGGGQTSPFVYDTGRLDTIDPGLIRFGEERSVRCPREEPKRIAIGPNDHLYIAAGNYVSVLDEKGGVESEIALNEPARCLAIGLDGTVYVGMRKRVELFSSTGRRLNVWEPPGARMWFTGIAVAENDVFVADAGNRVILRLNKQGAVEGRIGERDPKRDIPGFVVPSPYFDLALHPDGNLRAANPGRHRVECYTFEGEIRFYWGTASAAIDGFCGCCNPISLAHLSDGRCVTAEKGLARVKVYSDSGEFESVVAGPDAFGDTTESLENKNLEEGHPLDVAVDSHDRVAILDSAARKVRIMMEKT